MISFFEQEMLLSHILKKTREHVLTHPEIGLDKNQLAKYKELSARRLKNEPMAYILGHKGFYGLDFKVNRYTLIPRPETELLVEEIIKFKPNDETIIDIGTGSGNIIISLAKNIQNKNKFYGIDISEKALKIAKLNSKKNKVGKKIKFIESDLLSYFLKNKNALKNKKIILVANLPYLSKNIYEHTPPDVKKYEPKSALISERDGLGHYKKLLKQLEQLIKNFYMFRVTCYMEFSPEQKTKMIRLIKQYFPKSEIEFKKDLAQKWRMLIVKI
jgi:release factor glutamine methyltransferase